MQFKVNKKEYWFVLLIPIINAFATITTNFYPAGVLNPGTIRAIILFSFILYFIFKKYPINFLTKFLIFYVLFFGSLAYLSSNPTDSLYHFMKFFISVMMLPLGYAFFNTVSRLRDLNRVYLVVLIIFLLDILFANTFGYGMSAYLDDSILFGVSKVNITKATIIIIFTMPLIFSLENRKYHWLILLIMIIGISVSLIGIKRSVLLSALGGSLVYLFLSPFKAKLFKFSTILLILSLTVFSFFLDTFFERYEARGNRVDITEETFETEARYLEVFRVWESWVEGSVKHKLIGSELFNDREFYSTRRMLHTDYMILLSGSGLTGIFLWFLLFFLMIIAKNKYYPHLKENKFFRELNTIFWMLIIAQLFISISGSIYSINIRSLLYMYWGAIIGTMRTEALIKYHSVSNGKQENAK